MLLRSILSLIVLPSSKMKFQVLVKILSGAARIKTQTPIRSLGVKSLLKYNFFRVVIVHFLKKVERRQLRMFSRFPNLSFSSTATDFSVRWATTASSRHRTEETTGSRTSTPSAPRRTTPASAAGGSSARGRPGLSAEESLPTESGLGR